MARDLQVETFEPYVATVFVTEAGGATVELTLVDIETLPIQLHAPRVKPFALHFSGPPQPFLAQRTYRLSHADLGEHDIFLVPIAADPGGGIRYEAVFN